MDRKRDVERDGRARDCVRVSRSRGVSESQGSTWKVPSVCSCKVVPSNKRASINNHGLTRLGIPLGASTVTLNALWRGTYTSMGW